jgi:serine/threonine protein kinase
LEMAIGEPLFTLQRTYDVEYIKHRLQNPQGIVDEATQKLQHVEEGARNVILQCLVEDPAKRSTCDDLLNHDYFQKSTDIQ